MPDHPPPFSAAGSTGACERFLQGIDADSDLPALGSAVARVVQLASSDNEAVHNLTYFVLSDVSLTQKILRLANTSMYRTVTGGKPVTTVSRAIFLLGFDTIKTTALALLLVEGFARGAHAASVRAELAQALYASVIGREVARRSPYQNSEEAAIAALFKNLGRLLVAAHAHDLYQAIAALVEAGDHSEAQAAQEVLGCRLEPLAETVLRAWNMPDSIVRALAPLPARSLRPAANRQEWMQQVAAFSAESAALLTDGAGGTVRQPLLLARYGAALNLDAEKLDLLFDRAADEIRSLLDGVDLARSVAPAVAAAPAGLPGDLLMAPAEDATAPKGGCHASGKPLNARERLLGGVQDATQMMASGRCRSNELILLVLETLYHSMGFRFATVAVKDPKSGQFRARIAIGEQHAARKAGFVFPVASGRDLFHLALENDADLMISDAAAANIRDLIPSWHRALLAQAGSFIVLPLVVQKMPFGLFYADRAQPAPEGVPADEAALIKILKGQVLAALSQG